MPPGPREPGDPDDEPTDTRSPLEDEPTAERSGSMDVDLSEDAPTYTGPERRVEQQPHPGPERRGKPRTMQRAAQRVEDAVGKGVGKVGEGIEKVGGGIAHLGERVDKVPGLHQARIGAGVKDLGDGISDLGHSLTDVPKVARTRRGRVLVRSLIVGLLLVSSWIAAIIWFQLRGGEKPDLRPRAEQVMLALRAEQYRALFDEASPRFQEVTDFDKFQADMKDMRRVLGPFKEIAAINDTLLTRGPGGQIARVDATLDFEKGKARSSLSFHWHERRWKLLGIGVELPDKLAAQETTREAREERSKAPPEVRKAAEAILALAREGKAAEIWDAASAHFQQFVTKADFERIEAERLRVLGQYRRILDETKGKEEPPTAVVGKVTPGTKGAWITVLAEYEKANVSVSMSFERKSADTAWQLTSYNVVLPLPRAPRSIEERYDAAPAPAPPPATGSAAGADARPAP